MGEICSSGSSLGTHTYTPAHTKCMSLGFRSCMWSIQDAFSFASFLIQVIAVCVFFLVLSTRSSAIDLNRRISAKPLNHDPWLYCDQNNRSSFPNSWTPVCFSVTSSHQSAWAFKTCTAFLLSPLTSKPRLTSPRLVLGLGFNFTFSLFPLIFVRGFSPLFFFFFNKCHVVCSQHCKTVPYTIWRSNITVRNLHNVLLLLLWLLLFTSTLGVIIEVNIFYTNTHGLWSVPFFPVFVPFSDAHVLRGTCK